MYIHYSVHPQYILSYVNRSCRGLYVYPSVHLSVCLYICRREQIAEAINPSQELNCQLTSPLIVTCFLFTRSAAPVQEETAVPVQAETVLPVQKETAVPALAETVLPVQDEIRPTADRPAYCYLLTVSLVRLGQPCPYKQASVVPVRKKKWCWMIEPGPLIVVRFLFFFSFYFTRLIIRFVETFEWSCHFWNFRFLIFLRRRNKTHL